MKIAITYQPQEFRLAAGVIGLIRRHYPDFKSRKSERHAPFIHVHLTIKIANHD